MSELYATCTPNSLPVEGKTPHGYQVTVLDERMAIADTFELAALDAFDADQAELTLTNAGYVPQEPWSAAGAGYMCQVARVDEL
ncbi:hypothetical protein ACFC0S_15705 [Streptomyces sp. NPDC056084]|uniref:hypothetical protein n=1 Tax=unclassified Streptomyces TaxID=2593676 RepID=UPI0035DCC804